MPGRVPSPLVLILLLPVADAAAAVPGPVELRDQVDADRLQDDLRALTGHDPIPDGDDEVLVRTRNVHHPHHRLAGAWIEDRFEAVPGLDVSRETFDAAGESDLFNVVAELPGAEPDLPILILGAHYDSIASATVGWEPATDAAPGADDDASGVAAILEVARVLAAHPGGTRRTVRFVAFSAEEYGLLGAYEHVARVEDRGDDVALMLSLDPVGYDPGGTSTLWVPYDARWEEPADRLAEVAAAQGGRLSITTIDADLIGGDARSDHFPFWDAGIPALHLASFPQPPTYHTVSDDLDVVDPTFHGNVTALVAAFAAAEVELLEPPDDEGDGCGECGASLASGASSGWLLAATLAASRRRRR